MLKSLIYKEWIKIRWLALAILVAGILMQINIFLKVRHDIIFVDAANYWYSVLFRNYQYFGSLKFLPLIGGLGLAIAQYFPETVNKRIKLTFHLPVDEDEILIKIQTFGAMSLIAIFLLLGLFFFVGSSIFFPAEIIIPALLSSAPWFMGGLASYFLVGFILLEPIWLYRGLYAVLGAGFINFFYVSANPGGYAPVLPMLTLLTLLAGFFLLFSGYRFRKGEM